MKPALMNALNHYIRQDDGGSLVEYAVALVVVTIVGAVIFGLGTSISGIINASAGAF